MKNRKLLPLILALCVAMCFGLCACGDDDKDTKEVYRVTLKSTVNLNADGKMTGLSMQGIFCYIDVEDGDVIGTVEIDSQRLNTLNNNGYTFYGWFTDQSYTIQWNTLTDPVKCNMTLYAKWEKA